MHICYLDEAGCTGALSSPNAPIQPVFVLGGLFIDESRLRTLTDDFLHLKQHFFPNLLQPGALYHDWMAVEVKGSEVRKSARSTSRNKRRAAYTFLTKALNLLESHGAKFAAKAYVKPIAGPFDGPAIYTSTVQSICTSFQRFIADAGSRGIVIADSRDKRKNANVSHSIFTQRHRAAGDPYPNLVEVPTFGHSDNHAGLQMIDLLCSALLFPIIAQGCCAQHVLDQTHVSPYYDNLAARFKTRIRALQYRYQDDFGRWRGGLTLADPMNLKSAAAILY